MGLIKLLSSLRYIQRSLNHRFIAKRSCCHNVQEEGGNDRGDRVLDSSKKGLVLGVYETNNKFELSAVAAEVNQKSGDKINKHLNELSSQLKLGKAFALTDILPEYSAVALVSLGPKEPGYNELEALDETRENVRWGVGAGVSKLAARGCGEVLVGAGGSVVADAAAEAAELASWRFEEFKSDQERSPSCRVSLYGVREAGEIKESGESKEGSPSSSEDGALWAAGSIRGQAQNWARFLSDMPANKMTPVDLAQAALDTLCPLGVTVEARDRAWLQAQDMQAVLAVARGSCQEPVFLECTYRGARDTRPPVVLAAKGVTFDSGGLCLKKREGMVENRGSMAGAAVVLAAMKILAQMKTPINVCAVIPLCENMVSGQCMKVGDVVRALNGIHIQIEDTDMEGRLLLADALVYAQAQYRPELLIDVATLTHGVLLATGGGAFGCFTRSGAAWGAARRAGAASGERPWRLPLWRYYTDQLTNDPSVDLRNKGAGHASPCLGAAFLEVSPVGWQKFVCAEWVHMDITGVGKLAHAPAPPYLRARRMTGRPARALAHLLQDIACASPPLPPPV